MGKDMNSAKYNKRNHGLDALRCIAMIMVVILHYLDKGDVLRPLSDKGDFLVSHHIAWFLEALCIVAVNLYMLMSGYLLYKGTFKLSRLLGLVGKVWLYSVIVGLIGIALKLPNETVDTYFILRLLFPVSMNTYWFMTAYIFFYLLVPVLGYAARLMSREKMKLLLIGLIVFHVIIKSVSPFKLTGDASGMDAMWYIVLYFVAVYIRRFTKWGDEDTSGEQKGFMSTPFPGLILYLAGCLLIYGEAMLLRSIYIKTDNLSYILNISYAYNHVLVLAASVALFTFFLKIKVSKKAGIVFEFLGKYSLGVYLLHENLSIRYAWERLFGCDKITGVIGSLVMPLIAGIVIFITGVLIEFAGCRIAGAVLGLLKQVPGFSNIASAIKRADRVFAAENGYSVKSDADEVKIRSDKPRGGING